MGTSLPADSSDLVAPPAAVGQPKFVTLKVRAEFNRVRGGGRYAGAAFVLEGKARSTAAPTDRLSCSGRPTRAAPTGPRFGFTITKKLGGAVVRNRMRRRLKAAITGLLPIGTPRADYDYVVVAREGAAIMPFAALIADLERAFEIVHRPPKSSEPRGPRRSGPPSTPRADRPPRSDGAAITGKIDDA